MVDIGFTTCGVTGAGASGATERYSDVDNTQTLRASATARSFLAGFSLNGFGFSIAGRPNVGTTERFDDSANTHTTRTPCTARSELGGYSTRGFGFSTCGFTNTSVGTTERFEDESNTWTSRATAAARRAVGAYSLNGFGFFESSGGGFVSPTTQRFDDTANTHTNRQDLITFRYRLACYSMSGFGYSNGGAQGAGLYGNVERFDDNANVHTDRATITPRRQLSGFSLNGFGYALGGAFGAGILGTNERFDEISNTQTSRQPLGVPRYELAGYAITPTCPTTRKYSGDTISMQATPRDGVGPYSVTFRKDNIPITGCSYINVIENTTVICNYLLTDDDARSATTGMIDFSVFITDSCPYPIGPSSCEEYCIIYIGCITPSCNFIVT